MKFSDYVNEEKMDLNKPFAVVRSGGSIGGNEGPTFKGKFISSTHDSLDDAKEKAKRMNKVLSKGEKQYYKIKYSAVELDKKLIKQG